MVALRAVPVWLLRGAFVVGVLASAPALAENTNAQPDELFSVPALSLRLESPADSAEPAASVSNPPRLELAGPPSGGGAEERMDLASAGVATEFPGYGERSMLVESPAARPGRFGRAMDTVFRPEVVRYRNVDISCSIVTAIKRKNPLCLLNPIVVHISW